MCTFVLTYSVSDSGENLVAFDEVHTSSQESAWEKALGPPGRSSPERERMAWCVHSTEEVEH